MTSDPSGRILSVSQSEDCGTKREKKEQIFLYFKKISEQENTQKPHFTRFND